MKPKVLLDISLLGHAKAVRRGMERVADHLFHGLRESGQCELSCVATSHLVGAYNFLKSEGVSPEAELKFRPGQLRVSQVGFRLSQVIERSIEDRSIPARARRWGLAHIARACCAGESRLTPDMLRQADIYHSPHTPFPKGVQQAAHLRKFITVHDFNPLKFPEFFSKENSAYMDGLRACLNPGNFAFCVSETVRNDILAFATIPAERIFVTPLAADKNIFYPETDPGKLSACRARYGIPEGPYFLSVSAHAPHKNYAHLVDCFGSLVESGELSGTSLVIVGPNPQRNAGARQALEKYPRAKPLVVIAGRVPDEDMAAVYSGAMAFLFPSLFEGFGMPPLEAMQCNLPVIASNATSIPEVVGPAGILLPPKDTAAWCQAMLQMANNPGLRNELAEKSKQRAQLFSWQKFIAQTLNGYKASFEIK
jgi:glycosyltransferase involved in cell wall biosynthesis